MFLKENKDLRRYLLFKFLSEAANSNRTEEKTTTEYAEVN
jgi:hypothetical protein